MAIYAILDGTGAVVWVGASSDPKRRLREHRRKRGFGDPALTLLILEENPASPVDAEARWIAHYRALGAPLRNKADRGKADAAGLQRLREYARRPKSAETRARMSAALKGRPRNWSEEGRKRVEATQFRKGGPPKTATDPVARANHQAAMQEHWDKIPP
jgi:hypothetical protein